MFSTGEKNKNTKGFTLVEITVVLAVVAVIAVMTVSFVALVGMQSQIAKNSGDISSDISYIESDFRKFIMSYDDSSYTFSVSDYTITVKESNADSEISTFSMFSIKDKILSYTRPDETDFSRTLKRTESASFSVLKSGDSGKEKYAILCKFSYQSANGKSKEEKIIIRTVRAAKVEEVTA